MRIGEQDLKQDGTITSTKQDHQVVNTKGIGMEKGVLILDFGANRRSIRNKRVFSNCLEDQFSNLLQYHDDGFGDFEDFVRSRFMKNELNVFISYPNFIRKSLEKERYVYYNNVALRIPQNNEDDIVLMCDIVQYNPADDHPDRPIQRTFQVKSILSMDPNICHYGEIEILGNVLLNLEDGKEKRWESEADLDTRWIPDEKQRNNVLTNDFLSKLNDEYVVPDHNDVIRQLDDWESYIESRKYLVERTSNDGYSLGECIPEVFKAFNTPGYNCTDDSIRVNYLKTGEWTRERVSADSQEKILLHFYVDYLEKDYQSSKKEKDLQKQLDSFTRTSLILKRNGENNTRQNKKQEERIGDKRIETSYMEIIEPLEELKSINEWMSDQIAILKNDIEIRLQSKISSELEIYEKTELVTEWDKHLSEMRESLINRITKQCESGLEIERERIEKKRDELSKELEGISIKIKSNQHRMVELKDNLDNQENGIDKLEKENEKLESNLEKIKQRIKTLDDSISSLQSKFDPEPRIGREIEDKKKTFWSNSISNKRSELNRQYGNSFEGEFCKKRANIVDEANERKEKIKHDLNKVRFHLYFDIEYPENESIDNNIQYCQGFMCSDLLLCKDYYGEKAILDRQDESLHNLKEGYVLNPFIATFLFSPKSQRKTVIPEISDYIIRDLNKSQREAVNKALSSNGLFLIQGPPGTGKTQVIAEIAAQLARSGRRVLIASQNNKAVDNAFDRIPKIPFIRPLRVLSEKAGKQENTYAESNLLKNFYSNISHYLEAEVEKFENRERYLDEMNRYIDHLEGLLDSISKNRKDAGSVESEIKDVRSQIYSTREEKDNNDVRNNEIRDNIDRLRDEIGSVIDFSNEQCLRRIIKTIKYEDLNIDDWNVTAQLFKRLHDTNTTQISIEYSIYAEHSDFFDLKAKKDAATEPSEIASLNKELAKYRDVNEFDESDQLPLLSSFSTVPEKDLLSSVKDIVDTTVSEKIHSLESKIGSLEEDLRDPVVIKDRIDMLERQLKDLEEDESIKKLKAAELDFDTYARDLFVKLDIPHMPPGREDIIKKLENQRDRFIQESRVESGSDFKEAFSDISRYLLKPDIIEKDKSTYNSELVKVVNVIGMTCSAKAYFKSVSNNSDIRLNEMNIDVVIVDEVSKVPFIEIIQPILYGKTVILVGDHRQLPPMFDRRLNKGDENPYDEKYINEENEAKYREMYERSYFAELFDKAPESMKVRLGIQYRMHPDIMEVDNEFYNTDSYGKLEFGGNKATKNHHLQVTGASGTKLISEDNHVLFVDVRGKEHKESGSTSFTNKAEADTILALLDMIDKSCRTDANGQALGTQYKVTNDTRLSVGVICAYADQARLIRKEIKNNKLRNPYRSFNANPEERFMVKTVDDFQGDERDIIILSMVRTEKSNFLEDYRRINVAISRARSLLIIVGNKRNLESMNVNMDGKSVPVYRNILKLIQRRNGIRTQEDVTGGQ